MLPPSKLLTDNGPQFANREFKSFKPANGVLSISLAALTLLSPMVLQKMQSDKPRPARGMQEGWF